MAKELKRDDLQELHKKLKRVLKKFKKKRQLQKKKAEEVSTKLVQTERELETTHRQALFLRNLANPKYENAVESLHMINTYAKSIKTNLDKVIRDMRKWEGTQEYSKDYKKNV